MSSKDISLSLCLGCRGIRKNSSLSLVLHSWDSREYIKDICHRRKMIPGLSPLWVECVRSREWRRKTLKESCTCSFSSQTHSVWDRNSHILIRRFASKLNFWMRWQLFFYHPKYSGVEFRGIWERKHKTRNRKFFLYCVEKKKESVG